MCVCVLVSPLYYKPSVKRVCETDDHNRLLATENDDAAADTYDSDADCCRLRRRRALSTGGHSAS